MLIYIFVSLAIMALHFLGFLLKNPKYLAAKTTASGLSACGACFSCIDYICAREMRDAQVVHDTSLERIIINSYHTRTTDTRLVVVVAAGTGRAPAVPVQHYAI